MNANLRKIERAIALVRPLSVRFKGRRPPGLSFVETDRLSLEADRALEALVHMRVVLERSDRNREMGAVLRGAGQ